MKQIRRFVFAVILTAASVPSTVMAVEISEGYLEGAWCFTHTMSGKEKSEEMRSYIFEKGGKYSHQTSRTSSRMKEGFSYQILPGKLKLKPEFPGELNVKSASEDHLVLNYFVDFYFTRGACR